MTYSAPIMARARELRAAEWPLRTVSRMLAEEFSLPHAPTSMTILRWTNPDWAESDRLRTRDRTRRLRQVGSVGCLGRAYHSPDLQEVRVRALAGAGMTRSNIVRAMQLDYPAARWTRRRVDALLGPIERSRTSAA